MFDVHPLHNYIYVRKRRRTIVEINVLISIDESRGGLGGWNAFSDIVIR